MEFSVNSPIIYVMVGLIIAAVLGQSIYFLVRALKRAKEIGIESSVIKNTVSSSAIFTIAPAIAIVIGVLTLSKSLGVPLPWLRLSIIGSLTYETTAAQTAMSALGIGMGATITDASTYITVLWVMTLGIIIGLVLVPILTKKIQKGMIKIETKDKKWGEILNSAMFLGMISAFLGYVFCNVDRLWRSVDGVFTTQEKIDGVLKTVTYSSTSGLIPILVMASSAVVMAAIGLLAKKTKARWLTDYALPVSLIAGMALAIPFTAWLG